MAGRYPVGKLKYSGDLPEVEAPAKRVNASVLKNRPDIKAAIKRYESADSSASAAEKARLPNIVLSADLFRSNKEFGKLSSTKNSWGLFGNLLYPLFNMGRLKSEASAAEREVQASYMDMGEKVLTAMREAEDAFAREEYIGVRLEHLEKAVKSAEKSSRYYEKRYISGLVDLISLQNAREQEIDVKSSLIETKAQRIINRIDMALALGVGVMNEAVKQ